MKISVLSDIHGNLEALKKVITRISDIDAMILLGDLIDYGPHSNEVIELLKTVSIPILCNIWGNHEQSISTENYDRFSSVRGRLSAKYTKENLNGNSYHYIKTSMQENGMMEFDIEDKKCLAIHGSLEDKFWKAIKPATDLIQYQKYDYVFSGHSHLSHVFSNFFDCENSVYRNKKRTTFVNPGSVGQPRNHNPKAQFVIWDTDTDDIRICAVNYDIKKEQSAFSDTIDMFYKDRLLIGV